MPALGKIRVACRAFLLLSLAATSAFADFIVFGPRTYVLNTGAPQTLTDTFTIDPSIGCDGKASFLLMLANSGVASGSVTLNGATLLTERDLNAAQSGLEIPVQLAATNQLTVELKGGRPGSNLVISIRRLIEEPVQTPLSIVLSTKQGSRMETVNVAPTDGSFVLVVENGQGGTQMVKGGSIRFNGIEVVDNPTLGSSARLIRRRVSVRAQNTLSIDLRGDPGNVVVISIRRLLDESACAPKIAISAPAEGQIVRSAEVLVSGTVSGPPDLGVVVNDQAAEVDFSYPGTTENPFRWLVLVSLEPGPVELRAVATTSTAARGEAVRTITFTPYADSALLRAYPSGGISPLTVRFVLEHDAALQVVRYETDLDGDGLFEGQFDAYPETLMARYEEAGPRIAQVRVTTADGGVTTSSTVVMVRSFAVFDAMLRRVWTGFTTALARRDIDAALAEMTSTAREKYRQRLILVRESLPDFAAGLAQIDAKWIHGEAACYLLRRTENGRVFGYHLYFVRDTDGVWRIVQF